MSLFRVQPRFTYTGEVGEGHRSAGGGDEDRRTDDGIEILPIPSAEELGEKPRLVRLPNDWKAFRRRLQLSPLSIPQVLHGTDQFIGGHHFELLLGREIALDTIHADSL